jgi:hypothetical protein
MREMNRDLEGGRGEEREMREGQGREERMAEVIENGRKE